MWTDIRQLVRRWAVASWHVHSLGECLLIVQLYSAQERAAEALRAHLEATFGTKNGVDVRPSDDIPDGFVVSDGGPRGRREDVVEAVIRFTQGLQPPSGFRFPTPRDVALLRGADKPEDLIFVQALDFFETLRHENLWEHERLATALSSRARLHMSMAQWGEEGSSALGAEPFIHPPPPGPRPRDQVALILGLARAFAPARPRVVASHAGAQEALKATGVAVVTPGELRRELEITR